MNISNIYIKCTVAVFSSLPNRKKQQKLWDDLDKGETPEAWYSFCTNKIIIIHTTITVHSLRSNETKQNDTCASMVCIQQPSGNIRMSSYITNHLLNG